MTDRQSLTGKFDTPLQLFYRWENERPNAVFLNQPRGGHWKTYSYAEAGQEIRRMAAHLISLGLPPRSAIAIWGKNSAHWIMADLAIWIAGHISVPIYGSISAKSASEILAHSESKAVFVGNVDHAATASQAFPSGMLRIDFPHSHDQVGHSAWSQTQPLEGRRLRDPLEIATIIYTSGTTGEPKGALHDFLTMALVAHNISSANGFKPGERFFSYLPLAHVGERAIVEMGALSCGGCIGFADGLDTFPRDLATVKPNVMLAVPRILTRFQAGILKAIPQPKLDRLLALPLVGHWLRRRVQRQLGVQCCNNLFTGAAPVPKTLLEWFARLGISVREGYAMTENFAISHLNLPNQVRLGSVGSPLKFVSQKIGQDGEVLVATPTNLRGYFKNEALTSASFDGDYFKTGDRGEVDADGYLWLTGRVKDLFKTNKGKYVSPVPIENALAKFPGVQQSCVVGSNLPQPVALLVVDHPLTAGVEAFQAGLKTLNESLENHERLAKLVIVKEPWTIENGLLTPTLKIKRQRVEDLYAPQLVLWNAQPSTVIVE